jgi:hypothetical protein
MGLTPIDLGPYNEGVNLVDPPVRLSPNELSRCLNLRIGYKGDFYKRPGHDYYGANSGSSGRINGDNLVTLVTRFYKADGTKILLGSAGGKFRKGTDAGGTWTDISVNGTGASVNSNNLADWMVYKNRIYITDGTHPHRYNGTDDLFVGYFTYPTPSLAESGGGALTTLNTYKYFVTSVAGDMGEGTQGTIASFTLTGANNRITLTNMNPPAGSYEETTKRIYRTVGNGSVYFFLTELPTGTTSFIDGVSDANLQLNPQWVPVHSPATETRFCLIGHDDRAYWFGRTGVNASLVEVSDVGFPDRILDGIGFFAVANNDGDIVTGGGLVPGGMVFFKRNSTWLLRYFGSGLTNIYPREKRGAGIGTTSPFSVVTTPAGLIFLSQRGEIYRFDGNNLEEIGRQVTSEFRDMPQTARDKVVACYHDFRYIVSYDWRGSKSYNWRTLEYDIRTGKWEGPHENGTFYNPSYYSVWDSVYDKGELTWGESLGVSNGSRVYVRGEFSKLDRGNRFISTIKTGALPLARLGEVKTTKIFVDGDYSADVTLKAVHIDEAGVRTEVRLQSSVSFTGAIYNTSKYNSGAKYAGLVTQVLEGPFGPGSRSRTPVFEISDSGSGTSARINAMSIITELLSLK